MGQTPLHYAHLFMYSDDTVDYLISKGARTDAKDVVRYLLYALVYHRDTIIIIIIIIIIVGEK